MTSKEINIDKRLAVVPTWDLKSSGSFIFGQKGDFFLFYKYLLVSKSDSWVNIEQ